MQIERKWNVGIVVLAIMLFMFLIVPGTAAAHCDTLDGPVVAAARIALEKGDVTPVLKWVKKEHETEIKSAFQKTFAVRKQGADARELADRYFFETLVRLHRAGEGAPYTGLKSAGVEEPAVAAADAALESGAGEHLARKVAGKVEAGIRTRFARTLKLKQHADESVEAGRAFVEAYVEFIHYVERLHLNAEGHATHTGAEAETHN